jgi:hypothetical protein
MIVTKTIFHTALYPILAHSLRLWYGFEIIRSSILKFFFYTNVLLMVGGWYESMLIAKGQDYDERDIAKALLFTVLFMVLIEIHWILGGL